MDKLTKTRRGGPRSFDRDEALDIAMRLFWRHGFEGVSLNDLTSAIGIAPPSLYAAFGSKAGLYREALERYSAWREPGDFGPAMDLLTAVRQLLDRAINSVTDPEGERGCMISSGMLECGEDHLALARDLTDRRQAMRESIALKLQTWLDPDQAASLSRYLMTVLLGLSVQARDGASREDLQEIARQAVTAVEARGLAGASSGG
ncbi:TetR/AcrR family transcriptional regulator [Rhizobium sp. YIM 134829]|uniref:TetR/AcrR family transcriptional regulator n=1 Tax=Rhizobium sp. YIM 134829 TaxID=3390453 RepID=UPI00397C1D56